MFRSLFSTAVAAAAQSLHMDGTRRGHIVIIDFLANDAAINGRRQRHRVQIFFFLCRNKKKKKTQPLFTLTEMYCFHSSETSSPADAAVPTVSPRNKNTEFIFVMDRYTSARV